jgi:hypothetical protein
VRVTGSTVMAAAPSIAAAVGLIIGGPMPWARFESEFLDLSVAGTDGDGTLTLLIGVGVAALTITWLFVARTAKIVLAICAGGASGLAGLIALVDLADIEGTFADDPFPASDILQPGAGLWLTIGASVLGMVGAAIMLVAAMRVPRDPVVFTSPWGVPEPPAWGAPPPPGAPFAAPAGPVAPPIAPPPPPLPPSGPDGLVPPS